MSKTLILDPSPPRGGAKSVMAFALLQAAIINLHRVDDISECLKINPRGLQANEKGHDFSQTNDEQNNINAFPIVGSLTLPPPRIQESAMGASVGAYYNCKPGAEICVRHWKIRVTPSNKQIAYTLRVLITIARCIHLRPF